MPQAEEWDWPPPRRTRAEQIEIESRIVEERIVVPRKASGSRKTSATSQPPDRFTKILVGIAQFVVAVPLALIALGAVWLLSVLVKT